MLRLSTVDPLDTKHTTVDYIADINVDVLGLREAWLHEDNLHHLIRSDKTVRRFAVLHMKSFDIYFVNQKASSFEFTDACFTSCDTGISLLAVYCIIPRKGVNWTRSEPFCTEFMELFDQLVTKPTKFTIAGHFNMPWDLRQTVSEATV